MSIAEQTGIAEDSAAWVHTARERSLMPKGVGPRWSEPKLSTQLCQLGRLALVIPPNPVREPPLSTDIHHIFRGR